MAPDPRRRLTLLFALVGVASGLAALFTVWQWVGAARSGWAGLTFDTSFETKGFHLTVRRVDPLSPAERAGIREMDRVGDIGGIPIEDAAGQRGLRGRLRTGDDVAYAVRRGDQVWTANLRLENPLAQWLRLLDIGLNALAALVFLGIGGFVFWKRPGMTGLCFSSFYALSTGCCACWSPGRSTPIPCRSRKICSSSLSCWD